MTASRLTRPSRYRFLVAAALLVQLQGGCSKRCESPRDQHESELLSNLSRAEGWTPLCILRSSTGFGHAPAQMLLELRDGKQRLVCWWTPTRYQLVDPGQPCPARYQR
jgi:hypothetical protein